MLQELLGTPLDAGLLLLLQVLVLEGVDTIIKASLHQWIIHPQTASYGFERQRSIDQVLPSIAWGENRASQTILSPSLIILFCNQLLNWKNPKKVIWQIVSHQDLWGNHMQYDNGEIESHLNDWQMDCFRLCCITYNRYKQRPWIRTKRFQLHWIYKSTLWVSEFICERHSLEDTRAIVSSIFSCDRFHVRYIICAKCFSLHTQPIHQHFDSH